MSIYIGQHERKLNRGFFIAYYNDQRILCRLLNARRAHTLLMWVVKNGIVGLRLGSDSENGAAKRQATCNALLKPRQLWLGNALNHD